MQMYAQHLLALKAKALYGVVKKTKTERCQLFHKVV